MTNETELQMKNKNAYETFEEMLNMQIAEICNKYNVTTTNVAFKKIISFCKTNNKKNKNIKKIVDEINEQMAIEIFKYCYGINSIFKLELNKFYDKPFLFITSINRVKSIEFLSLKNKKIVSTNGVYFGFVHKIFKIETFKRTTKNVFYATFDQPKKINILNYY